MATRLAQTPKYRGLAGMVNGHPAWTGEVRLVEDALDLPLRWKKPRRIFVNSMSDLFHEKVPDEWIGRIFEVIGTAQQHVYQILTKRPERMLAFVTKHSAAGGQLGPWPWSQVWLGVSVEDQATADERIPLLLKTPAAVRWVSYEPALGPVDFSDWLVGREENGIVLGRPAGTCVGWTPPLDWLVIGGESGPKARPFDLAWARSVIAQYRAAGVPCFVKQLGSNPVATMDDVFADWKAARPFHPKLRDRKGGDPAEWPKDLRIREYPQGDIHAPDRGGPENARAVPPRAVRPASAD